MRAEKLSFPTPAHLCRHVSHGTHVHINDRQRTRTDVTSCVFTVEVFDDVQLGRSSCALSDDEMDIFGKVCVESISDVDDVVVGAGVRCQCSILRL